MKSTPKALTIAGSDSGAGIQADLKTFAALSVYGTSVITVITAQNTVKVSKIFELRDRPSRGADRRGHSARFMK